MFKNGVVKVTVRVGDQANAGHSDVYFAKGKYKRGLKYRQEIF
jgi:hypothetical protein